MPIASRLIAAGIGIFYLVIGAWAFVDPPSFAQSVATFSPFNRHLLHDSGAFSAGLGLVLILAAWMAEALRPALLGVLGASVLHLGAHIEDMTLGGHPSTDIPILMLICAALAAGVLLTPRRNAAAPRALVK